MTSAGEARVALGDDLAVSRMGFGAMRLAVPSTWAPPIDRRAAIAVARRAVELGVTFVDTADAYGLGANEELLAEALHPYPEGLVIATKAGQCRPDATEWVPLGRPEYLRQQAELSLRRLRVERIDLFQLHRVDPTVPLAEQVGALRQLQEEGKIRHVGLSDVTVEQIEAAREIVEIVSVQHRYNVTARGSEDVLEHCEREGLAFIAWQPVGKGEHASASGAIGATAAELAATPAQVALAWLLHRSAVLLPIPGTQSIAHLEQNVAARELELSPEQVARLSLLGDPK